MKYTAKSFTVPASSTKAPAECAHAWVDEKRGRCVLCGHRVGVLSIPSAHILTRKGIISVEFSDEAE